MTGSVLGASEQAGIAFDILRKGYRDVLALVTSTGPLSPAAFAGVEVAAKFGANLVGCYIAPSLRSLHGTEDEPSVMALLMDVPRESREDHEAFVNFAHAKGVRHASWTCTKVPPAKTMRSLGAWHDLIIVERDLTEESVLFDVMGESLLACRTACLMLPPRWNRPTCFGHVVIGWNGGIEAARAIHSALPIAMAAHKVTLLWDDALSEREPPTHGLSFDPEDYLRVHGVAASRRRVRAQPYESGKVLLSEAARLSADCLVMGAYGHARMRENVLGGATKHVLRNAQIPVLMQH